MEFRGAVYVDRDGTLIEGIPYLHSPEQVRLIPGTGEAVARLNAEGYAVVLVTNQSGVARGYFPESAVARVHARLGEALHAHGAHLDALFHCPHHPDGRLASFRTKCRCRKPGPGMIERARKALGLEGGRQFVIGDNDVDLGLAHTVDLPGILVRTGYGREKETALLASATPPVRVAETFADAVAWILDGPRR